MHEADPHLGSDFGFMGLLLSQRLWKLHSQYLPEWVYTAGETKALGEIAKSYICTPAGNKWRSLSISFLLSEACRPCNQTRRPYSKTIVSDDSLLRKESVSLRMLANKTKWKTGSLHNFYLMSHNFGDDSWALIQISKTTLWTYRPFIHMGPELGAPSAGSSQHRAENECSPGCAKPILEPAQRPLPWPQLTAWRFELSTRYKTAARANGWPLILVLKLGFIILQNDFIDTSESILYF